MKQALISATALMVSISLFGCGSDKPTDSDGGSGTQMMYVYADRCQRWNEQGDSLVDAAIVGGVILGDPVPEFDHVAVNDSVFAGDDYCTYYEGYCSFGSFG